MNELNTQRFLNEIDTLLSMTPLTLTPDTLGKQFFFVTFHQVVTGFDVKAHTLENVIDIVNRGDNAMVHITVGVDCAEITTDNTSVSCARIGDFLSAKLQRDNTPYPVIEKHTPSMAFTWKTTVDEPLVFNTLFPPPNQLDRPCYDILYILYQFALNNDLLGLYGSSLVKQLVTQLGLGAEFQWIIYDKLLGLSHVLNPEHKTRH